MKNIYRTDAIRKLIKNEIKTIVNDYFESDDSYANDIFTYGFKGYANFTNEELQSEYKDVFFPDGDVEIIDDVTILD